MTAQSSPTVTPTVTDEDWQIDAPGARLAGCLSRVAAPRLLVSINGATGVPARFYRPFARWLAADRQAAVLTWDYRDVAASGRPHRSPATMTDWATRDPEAARAALSARFPGLPVWILGHSLGGMSVGFQSGLDRVARIVTVASGHGHISDHAGLARARMAFFWHLAGPAATLALGRFPGARFGLGEDLPPGVFWQWRRWLLDPGALPADPALGGLRRPGYRGPMTTIAIEDDELLPVPTVRKMAAWHPEARIDFRLLSPGDFGLDRIGHVFPFHPRNTVLWPALVA